MLTVGGIFFRGLIIYICMCKNIYYRTIFTVRAIKFRMGYLMFAVGHFEIKNKHYQLKTTSIYFSCPVISFSVPLQDGKRSVETILPHINQIYMIRYAYGTAF